MQILDGKLVSSQLLLDLKDKVKNLSTPVNLDIILVGSDPASTKYVAMKQSKALSVGIGGKLHQLPSNVSEAGLLSLIKELNQDPSVTGFMVQLPLPSSLNTPKILSAINPLKDADGLNPTNLGLLFSKNPDAIPSATPRGIMELLSYYQINLDSKKAVIIGRSPIVGLPLFALLQNQNATVTLCHSKTLNILDYTSQADLLISAVGKPGIITASHVKPGAIVVDVGTSVDNSGKLMGDVLFEEVSPVCSFITPVPGGVGPMTVVSLLLNTYDIALKNSL